MLLLKVIMATGGQIVTSDNSVYYYDIWFVSVFSNKYTFGFYYQANQMEKGWILVRMNEPQFCFSHIK